ncbi:MAG: hypothetical protein KDK27_12525, partial [Leptospiraceae bacterium]|nr:hypothetical protein [Leptospiraceae bacterium]
MNTVLDVLARRIEATGNVWFTYHLRPHKSLPLRFYKSGIIEQKTAVIIQGPILENHDFTLSSVEMYRRIIPGAHLIVSTWKNTPEHLVENLIKQNVEVVLSEPPQISGIANVNYQIISSRAGIDAAVKSGRTFILKCR